MPKQKGSPVASTTTRLFRRARISSMVSARGVRQVSRRAVPSGIIARCRAPPTSTSAPSISARAAGASAAGPSSPRPTTVSQPLMARARFRVEPPARSPPPPPWHSPPAARAG